MIIVNVIGGLGSQMFQYALYKSLRSMGKDTKLDTSSFDYYKKHNGFELVKVFNINPEFSTKNEIMELTDSKADLLSRIRRKLFGSNSKYYDEIVLGNEFKYVPSIYDMENVYLYGHWQTEKYFKKIREELINDFKYDFKEDDFNKEITEKMRNEESVSIHVRRGDYINDNGNIAKHHVIKSKDYYIRAVEEIRKNTINPYFYIFSDDINWVKENLKIENSLIVDWNRGENAHKDMILMSNCKHNIIANSTFSWWGAWLNNNKDKIVIAPSKWDNLLEAPDIVCEDWKQIAVD